MFSTYKSHNTAKGLIGIAPNGMIMLVFDLATGRVSDRAVVKQSGLYSKLSKGDSVMADRGFLIKDDLNEIGAHLNIPPFLGGRAQLSLDEEETRKIAHLRIHVERVIREVKRFRLLRYVSMVHNLNNVWKICTYLCNFTNEPLVSR